jgi:hypothetical protein
MLFFWNFPLASRALPRLPRSSSPGAQRPALAGKKIIVPPAYGRGLRFLRGAHDCPRPACLSPVTPSHGQPSADRHDDDKGTVEYRRPRPGAGEDMPRKPLFGGGPICEWRTGRDRGTGDRQAGRTRCRPTPAGAFGLARIPPRAAGPDLPATPRPSGAPSTSIPAQARGSQLNPAFQPGPSGRTTHPTAQRQSPAAGGKGSACKS